ncbi:tripartite ATP-independent transporter DctM subunit [Winogradskyella eximia]|uniref:TRAP transporter, DctM subunit n=2 Tax=Winogradskyella TaxID=286104 RepID=A0A1G7YA06_9FLAO|nr:MULTISPECIES: TRAP transporter large permease subunit [Winogradskyella]RED46778.1 tripartite ATP-independent transporter DctM subunit [Winogradskyella eximia]SDG93224.1 TRAP transporter, DctM subunit [Winogradskyella thalassocola]|tara:strand:+ start:18794 stop:20098 length:1305 start_codon:yes stop_codon:yes gene_type:complete
MSLEIISIIVLFVSFFTLLLLKVPVAYSIGISTTISLLLNIDKMPGLTTIAQRMTTGIDSFALLAIPFFVLAGEIMKQGGIANRLINFAKSLVASLPGGLAYVNVLASMLFGAISGSAVAAASAIGSIMTDRMEEEGYPRALSASVNITSSTTGLLIPPSNILIVYALASGGTASVAALFIAGYLPGILLGLAIMGYVAFIAINKGYARGQRATLFEIWTYFRKAFFSLSLLIIVVGGIVAGIFTATEASVIAVLYAAILSLIYGDMKIKDMPKILLTSAKTTAVVMFLICTSMAMSWLFSFEGIPEMISSFLLDSLSNKFAIFLAINIILLIVGTFMDMTPAVLIFTPIFLPVVTTLGMDPVHFGIVIVLNLCIGICTPPVGTLLFVGSGVANVSVTKVIRSLLPFLAIMVAVLMLISFIPEISMFLPRLFGL